jgi:hypothetical protein
MNVLGSTLLAVARDAVDRQTAKEALCEQDDHQKCHQVSVFAARRNATREDGQARAFVYNEKLLWTACEFRKQLLVVSTSTMLPFISFELNVGVRRTYRSRPMQNAKHCAEQ